MKHENIKQVLEFKAYLGDISEFKESQGDVFGPKNVRDSLSNKIVTLDDMTFWPVFLMLKRSLEKPSA